MPIPFRTLIAYGTLRLSENAFDEILARWTNEILELKSEQCSVNVRLVTYKRHMIINMIHQGIHPGNHVHLGESTQ